MDQKIRYDCNIGNNFKKMRLEHKISQEKLCAKLQCLGCDIGRTTYAKYESGELNIRASVLVELKKIYNCSYDDFLRAWKDRYPSSEKKTVKPKNSVLRSFQILFQLI